MRKIYILIFILINSNLLAQIGISNNAPNNDPNHLINNVLIGGGVTISNINFTGVNQQIGYFSNGNSIGMPSGIVMSSGHAIDADLGGSPNSFNTPAAGIQCNTNPNTICNDLSIVANSVPGLVGQFFSVSSINDMCVLEFDFIPESDTIQFNYSFGSEEYLTWVNSSYNDVFGFFISGPGITGPYSSPPGFPGGSQNIAVVPNSNPPLPITVSSVHPNLNAQYYNTGNTTISYNGYTDVFTATAIVQPCETYHIRLAIADGSDDYLDSGVFLEAGSFSSLSATIDTNNVNVVSDTLFVECIDSTIELQVGLLSNNYSILWSTGATTDSILVGPGLYSYMATNGNCVLYSDTVAIYNQTNIIVDTNVINISCFGLTDASIDLSVSGGTPPYSFYWIDSVNGFTSTQEDISSLQEAMYHCFVTDTNGCPVPVMSVEITEPDPLAIVSSSLDVSCNGLSDGEINLVISGGTPPYNVSWTSINGYSNNGSNITNLSPDTYTAVITDANNCGPLVEIISINEPSPITLFGISSDISCFGFADGSIDLTANGNGLSYSWTGPNSFSSNNEDIFNLDAGTYFVSLVDSSGCIGPSSNYIINEPTDIIVIDSISHVTCFDGNDGSIELTLSGGVGNYNVLWTGSNSYFNISEDIFSLSSGSYSYSITDNNGCSPSINNSPLLVSQPIQIQISAAVIDETCYGDSDGAIDVTLNGPGIYSFDWVGPNSFSSNSLDISSLAAGTYNLTVTDQNNCVNIFSETVDIGNLILVNSFLQDISCFGFEDGNISLSTPNSINAFFSWIGPNSFISNSSQIINLGPGIYSVIVNDSSNCPTQLDFTISEPSELTMIHSIIDESCENYSDGEIEVLVNGGVPNYTYIWNNAVNTSINSNISNGTYFLSVLDDNNCMIADTFIVSLYLFDTTRQITNVNCHSGVNGSIDIEIVGGTLPFTYLWSNGDTTQDIYNLASAVYSVDITDATGCTIYRDVVVTEPQQLSVVSNTTPILCYGDSTGSVSLQINGGIPPYILDWGNIDTNAMTAGFYVYSVTDSNLCKFIDSVEIIQPDSMQIIANVVDVQCHGDFTGQIELQILQGSGTPPYSYLWTGPNNFISTDEDIYLLESGNYIVNITDINFCSQQISIYIDQPIQLSQVTTINTSNYSGYNVRCKGENSAWVSLDVSGGYTPYSYLWDNGSTSDSVYNLYAGIYSVSVTDSLGCKDSLSINLNEPSTYVVADIISTSDYNGYNIRCFGESNGSITSQAIDGVPPYSYLWSNNLTTQNITNLSSGYYEVFVYDNNMCLSIDSITLNEPEELTFNLSYFNDTCNKAVGAAEVSCFGGIPSYLAEWSNGGNSLIQNNFSSGNYSVVVSDQNSCNKSESFFIDNLPGPKADFEAYPYHKRFIDQKNDPFYFVDLSQTFWSSVNDWHWDFGDFNFASDSIVTHSYSNHGSYTVNLQIVTESGCIDTISKDVLIDDYSLYIPNSFIPSSNNKENSHFRSYGIGVKKYELKIFSRWGELLYKTNNLDEGWDGTYHSNDIICPQGIYTYTVYVENIYGEIFEYQGQLKLLR